MGLRERATNDAQVILNDRLRGFGWDIEITSPELVTKPLVGFSTDISQVIDPTTGQVVSGREASIAIHIQDLEGAGFRIPEGVARETDKPWVVKFDDIMGKEHTFKVSESNPDRAIGIVTCLLEAYK